MKCLLCYEWVKLPRNNLPAGKGIMGSWAKLASRVAYRKGTARYCGYENEVNAGMWAGGVVGLKSILGIKNRAKTLATMDELVRLGLVSYTIDDKTNAKSQNSHCKLFLRSNITDFFEISALDFAITLFRPVLQIGNSKISVLLAAHPRSHKLQSTPLSQLNVFFHYNR